MFHSFPIFTAIATATALLCDLLTFIMKITLVLSYLLRVSLLISSCLLVMFDSWGIAIAILPMLALDYYIHKTSTQKVMMGLFVMLLVVQMLVMGILGIKFMMFEDEESIFLESLNSPDSGFVDQVRASYADMRSGKVKISSGVQSLRYSASKAIADRAKTVQHSLGATNQTLSQYLHVTELISLFGEKTGQGVTAEGAQDDSAAVIRSAFGVLPNTTFPDLRLLTSAEVRGRLSRIFGALPAGGFSDKFVNPCWETEAVGEKEWDSARDLQTDVKKKSHQTAKEVAAAATATGEGSDRRRLHCLPAFHLLGQPKSGTTDLYSRLARHHDIHSPRRKEVSRTLIRQHVLLHDSPPCLLSTCRSGGSRGASSAPSPIAPQM